MTVSTELFYYVFVSIFFSRMPVIEDAIGSIDPSCADAILGSKKDKKSKSEFIFCDFDKKFHDFLEN